MFKQNLFTQRKFPVKNLCICILSVILAFLILSAVARAEGNSPDGQFPVIRDSPVRVSVDQTSTEAKLPTDNGILQKCHVGNWESLLILAFTILIILGMAVLKVVAIK